MVFQNTVFQLLKLIYLTNNYIQFVLNQNISHTHLNVEKTRLANINLSSIEFYHLQVQQNVFQLDANKASGSDNLSSCILKECAAVLASSLNFKINFASGHITTEM